MLLERWQCGIFAFGPDEKMQVNSMEAEENRQRRPWAWESRYDGR